MQKNFFGGFSPIATVLLLLFILGFVACKKDDPLELPKEEPTEVTDPANTWGTEGVTSPNQPTRITQYKETHEFRIINGFVGGGGENESAINGLVREFGEEQLLQLGLAPTSLIEKPGVVQLRNFTWTPCGGIAYRTFGNSESAAYQRVGVVRTDPFNPNDRIVSEIFLSLYYNSVTGKYVLVLPAGQGGDCREEFELNCAGATEANALWVSAIDPNNSGAMIAWGNLWADDATNAAIAARFGGGKLLKHLIFYFPAQLFTLWEVEGSQSPFAKMACGAASVSGQATTTAMNFAGDDCLQAGGTPVDAVTVNNFHYVPNFTWTVNGGTETAYNGQILALNLQTAQNSVQIDTLYRVRPFEVQADTLTISPASGLPYPDPAFFEVPLFTIERDPASGQLQQRSLGTAFRRINQPFYLRVKAGQNCP